MFDHIFSLPIESLTVLTAIFFVGTYWIGCILFRPVLRIFVRSGGGENDIVGHVLSAFGVFYGLLLSLIAVAAHQHLNQVDADAKAEAAALFALHRVVLEFPEPQRSQLCSHLQEYCRFVIDEEWPLMRKGEVPATATGYAMIQSIRKGLLAFEPQTKREELLHNEAIDYLKEIFVRGRLRRYAAQSGIPAVMWYVVIVGAIINIGLFWLFDMKFITQLFLGGLLAFFLGALILLIAVLDRPYRSPEYGVSPKAHEFAYQLMTKNEGRGSPDPGIGKGP